MNRELMQQAVHALDVTIRTVLISGLTSRLQQSTMVTLGELVCFIGRPGPDEIALANRQLDGMISEAMAAGDAPLSQAERLLLVQVLATKARILSEFIKQYMLLNPTLSSPR